MDNDFKRFTKKIAGDGPAERQILLMKLTHEFENAPSFGTVFTASADSEEQQWIARIGALLSRVSIEYSISFKATRSTSVQFWQATREAMRQQLLAAVEEIKLELELDGTENIATVYDTRKQFDFLGDLKEIILSAENEVFVVDPYFDGVAFDTYLSPLGENYKIRVLCGKMAKDVPGHVAAFEDQFNTPPEIKKSKDIHDRLVIIDRTDCWIVGASIKDAGKKPTYLLPLQPGISATKISIYENLWKYSQIQ